MIFHVFSFFWPKPLWTWLVWSQSQAEALPEPCAAALCRISRSHVVGLFLMCLSLPDQVQPWQKSQNEPLSARLNDVDLQTLTVKDVFTSKPTASFPHALQKVT